MSDVEEQIDDVSDGGGDDLFGDDAASDVSQIEDNPPIASDDDQASDDGRRRSPTRDSASERDDRSQRDDSAGPPNRLTVIQDVVYRHGLPKARDGNMQLAKVPNFLRFVPEPYDTDEWEASEWDIENSKRRIPMNLVRYRRNRETGELESNANIYRWSDGSLTMQVGEEHFEIQVKAQVPPPRKAYMPDRDANRYVAAAHSAHAQLLTVGHVTEEWAIRPDKKRVDEDTERLREQMGMAKGTLREGEMIITTTQDPELQKKEAEMAEKERARAQRRRENAQIRMEGGAAGYRKGGLSIGDLEGARRSTSGRKRGPGGSSKRSRPQNGEYDSDDDGAHRSNQYDMEDGFIAASDDEESLEEDNDDDQDDILDDGDIEFERPRPKRKRTPSDDDADGEPDDDAPAASGDHSRRRVRRVVSDDDDDE